MQVHPSGNVVNFHYNGRESIKEKPLWPSEIVEENIVFRQLKGQTRYEACIL